MRTIVTVSHFCLAVFLVGCAGQERSARERPSPPQPSTNLPFALQYCTNLRGLPVTITTQAVNEACIYITGEVNRPGRIPWTNGQTLTKALELAGGFTGFASKSQVMLRRANGATEQYSFVPPVADRTKNAKLDTGDMVHVTSRAWIWPADWGNMTTVVRLGEGAIKVEGEVNRPGLYDYTNRLTVLRAIKLSGGFTQQASHKVRVVRASGILNVNCDKAIRDDRLDIEVFPGNVIQVPKRT